MQPVKYLMICSQYNMKISKYKYYIQYNVNIDSYIDTYLGPQRIYMLRE